MMLDTAGISAQFVSYLTGVFLHVALFQRGEWDLHVPKVCLAYLLFGAALVAWNVTTKNYAFSTELKNVLWLETCHFMGIMMSMVAYRVLWHRLKSFPGPFWARVSNFYATMLSSRDLHLYAEIESLHKQYGDFVRVGPTELSIIDPQAIDAIYSAKSLCTKGPFYNVLHPRIALNMIRDKSEHTRQRKVWDRGFGARALRDYEPRVAEYTNQLLARIEATKGSPINMSDWFNFYSFDVMGDLAFGKSFNMLRDGVKHYFMTCLHADMTNIGYLSHLPWLFPFFKMTPVLNAEHKKFWAWCGVQVAERRRMKPGRPDVFSWVLEDYERNEQTKQAELNLEGDAYLIVVAGSDTTAAVLTSLFFELATNTTQALILRAEVDEYFNSNKRIDYISLSKLQHLDAIINETLRLHPPVPSGVQRMTAPEGLWVGNTFVPGDTIVQVPLHTMFRDGRYFERPSEFIPERWTSRPELTKDSSIFTPFTSGPYSCIGKQLALMEIRYVVAQIVYFYDVKLAAGQEKKTFLDGKRDTFTLALGPLNLVFTPKQQVQVKAFADII